jgi:hypothetical protein
MWAVGPPYVIILPDCPFEGPGGLPKFLDLTPGCMMQDAVARFASVLHYDSPLCAAL